MNRHLPKQFLIVLTAAIIFAADGFAQLNFVVNSLADDQYSYAYDDPNTSVDESRDGICEDELGRCTIRAAIEESNNIEVPVDLSFSVTGTINLMDVLYPFNGSVINGNKTVEITALPYTTCFDIDENTQIAGILFNNVFNAIYVYGKNNQIGGVLNGNVFTNCYIAVEIQGDSNEVISNRFGIDENNVLKQNQVSIMILGSNNNIGRSVATFSNTICGSNIAGISISEGHHNSIKNNFIGTTPAGDVGLGNVQGIIIGGSDSNIIGGDNPTDGNVISGNSLIGIAISGVPPDNYSISTGVLSNIIGLDPTQTYAIPNGNGVVITNGARIETLGRNVIAGNTLNGVHIFGYDDETKSYGHLIVENKIGVNSNNVQFPNGMDGITIQGNVEDVTIGTNLTGQHLPNSIIGNQNKGINVISDFGYNPSKIQFRKNLVYQNSLANIFMSSQSNNGLLPPYGLSFNNNTIAGICDVPGALIDVYKSNINEFSPSAYQWLGSTTVGSNGVFAYEITDPSIEAVSLTATTSTGNTSGFGFIELITDVEKEDNEIPNEFSLSQNYPNPFNPSTTIKFSIPVEEFVSLKVFNSIGEEVAELLNETKPTGNYEINFNASGLSSGVYFYRLQAGEFSATKKLLLQK